MSDGDNISTGGFTDADTIAIGRGASASKQIHNHNYAPRAPIDPVAAQGLLDGLPLDAVPAPAALPAGSRVGHGANPLFVGREDELRQLAAALKAPRGVAVVAGLGGLGKTQLASEWAQRYGQFFVGGVFWLSFADAANVPSEVAACGGPGALDLPGFAALSIADQVARVQQEWQQAVPRLLVFDNCEDEALLREYAPKSGGCRVLLTSRRSQWAKGHGALVLPLLVLPRPDSVALLRKHRPDLSDAEADALADALGDLPLALHLAGSYLEVYADSEQFGDPQTFLTELRDARLLAHPALQGEDVTHSPTKHELHVGKTFALSLERLNADDPLDATARALLQRAACLAPGEFIPRALLLATLGLDKDDTAAAQQAERGLLRLQALGLLESADGGALRLHRLLHAFVAQTLHDEGAQAAVEGVVQSTASQINDAGYPLEMQPLLPHLLHIGESARARDDEWAAALLNTLGYYLYNIGNYTAAQIHLEHAFDINKRTLDSSDLNTATSVNNLGRILHAQGDYAAARLYYEHALQIRKQVLSPYHPDTAVIFNNLGELLHAQGDYAAAKPYYERALAIREQALGPTHPDTATSLNNVGYLLRTQGNLAAAKTYYERALRIREQTLGPSHPDTAGSLNNLGYLSQAQGDYAAAKPYFERALQINKQTLGPAHPTTATSLNNLGSLFRAQGYLVTARPYYERALAIREQTLGPLHPNTATSLNNLGGLLHAQGDYAAARPYFERALAIYEQALGPTHPDTARSLNNLGGLLDSIGDYAAARPYYERALAIYEQALGPTHPDTANSLNNLGYLLRAMGDYTAAKPYYERALAISEQALGPTHPHTASSLNNLGVLFAYQGDFAQAIPLVERALAIRKQILGPQHPQTQQAQQSLTVMRAAAQQAASAPTSVEEQIAQLLQQAEAAVAAALADPESDRAAQAAQLEARAAWAEEGEAEGSPYLALAARLRELRARLG